MTTSQETLAQRLRLGPLSVREATQLCRTLLSLVETTPHGAITTDTIVLKDGRPALIPEARTAGAGLDSDLYAVGSVLYESLTGRRWTPGTDPASADWSGVPWRLRRLLMRALSASQERRPDAATFQRALWVPRPSHRIWPAMVVILLAVGLISAFVLCKPLGLCWERSVP